jgi:hypothetical protein
MIGEGRQRIDSRRHGLFAALRRKQWWSFEGLDSARKLYFVILALEGFPSSYVSLKAIDYGAGTAWEEEHLGGFRAAPGGAVEVEARGTWGSVSFRGCAESGWTVHAATRDCRIECRQRPLTPPHANRLLTRDLDYNILQFPRNTLQGSVTVKGKETVVTGYGYSEHNWGVQPRQSTAYWLHFWTPTTAGIVMDCRYDSGVPHHYSCLWDRGAWRYLASPANFFFTPEDPGREFGIRSADLDLQVRPLYTHRSTLKLPPVLPFIDIDYYEILGAVEGTARRNGKAIPIRGIGKFDHNFNFW